MALNDTHLDLHTKSTGGTVSGTSATFTNTLSHHQLEELMTKARVGNYDLKLVAGVLTLAPRTLSSG
jgi:hypothetical protein